MRTLPHHVGFSVKSTVMLRVLDALLLYMVDGANVARLLPKSGDGMRC